MRTPPAHVDNATTSKHPPRQRAGAIGLAVALVFFGMAAVGHGVYARAGARRGVGRGTLSVALPAPTAGDASYGVAQVPNASLGSLGTQRGTRQLVYAGGVGGLSISLRSTA
jgi:hypothetical protein